MACTRDKNSPANYCLEQKAIKSTRDNLSYYYSPNGHAFRPALPEHYNVTHMPGDVLSKNSTDIESALFGINSCNLVKPRDKVYPELNKLPTVSFFEKPEFVEVEIVKQNKSERPIIL